MMVRLKKMGTQPSKPRSILEPSARSKGSHITDGWLSLRHASNSRPLPLAYSPPPCSSLKMARMRSMPSTEVRSKGESSARSSSSFSFSTSVALSVMPLMMMLRRCWWQSPR